MRLIKTISTVIAFSALAFVSFAGVPKYINYQGYLTDGDGNPVTDGGYTMTFTIYDAEASGNSKWSEQQVITVTDGKFTACLGAVNPIKDSVFADTSRYLGIKVGGDPEIEPRAQLASVPWAHRVMTVDSAAGGHILDDIGIGGSIGIGTDSALGDI
ncbi:MAG: hypothetical protein JSV44_06540, partial [Candidatus Zixiibacteriota bacterium]